MKGKGIAGRSEPNKTVLVVDDDPAVRGMVKGILLSQGYTVLEAEGAVQALRLAREAAVVHLLITDFSMPEVDGLELLRQFRVVHPQTPVLMVSGSLLVACTGGEKLGRFELLSKPFSLDELLGKVRKLLDTASSLNENSMPPGLISCIVS